MIERRPTTEAFRPTTGHFFKIDLFMAIDAIKYETFTFSSVFFSADTKLCSRLFLKLNTLLHLYPIKKETICTPSNNVSKNR
jgi:hypothetical protein